MQFISWKLADWQRFYDMFPTHLQLLIEMSRLSPNHYSFISPYVYNAHNVMLRLHVY